MAVETLATPLSYNGDGSTTDFTAPPVLDGADLTVSLVDAAGDVTAQTAGVDFTLVGSVSAGYLVRFGVAPATGLKVVIERDTPPTQPSRFKDLKRFPAGTTEKAFDRGALSVQDVRVLLQRALLVPPGEDGLSLPSRAARQGADADGTVLAFSNATGAPLALSRSTLVSDAGALVGAGALAQIAAAGNTEDARVEAEGDTQVARLIAEGDTQDARVQDQGDTEVARVTGQGDTEVARVTARGDVDVARVTAEGDTQDARVTTEGNDQVTRVNAEGTAQVASINAAVAATFYADTGAGITATTDGDFFTTYSIEPTRRFADGTPYNAFTTWLNDSSTAVSQGALYDKASLDDFITRVVGSEPYGLLAYEGKIISGARVDLDGYVLGVDPFDVDYAIYPGGPIKTGLLAWDDRIIDSAQTDLEGYVTAFSVFDPDGEWKPGAYDLPPLALELFPGVSVVVVDAQLDIANRIISLETIDGRRWAVGAQGVLEDVTGTYDWPVLSYEIDGIAEAISDARIDAAGCVIWLRAHDGREWRVSADGALEKQRVRLPIPASTHIGATRASVTYTAITAANPAVVSANAHGLRLGQLMEVFASSETDIPSIAGKVFFAEPINANGLYLVDPNTGLRLDTTGETPSTGGTLRERRNNAFVWDNVGNIVFIVIGLGQSGMEGGDVYEVGAAPGGGSSGPVVSTVPEYPDCVFQPVGGTHVSARTDPITAVEPLQEVQGDNTTETIFSGYANNMVRDMVREFGVKPAGVLCMRAPIGGTPESKMGPGDTVPGQEPVYERMIAALESAAEMARRWGKIPVVLDVIDFQGSAESNEGPSFRPNSYDVLMAQKLRKVEKISAAARTATDQPFDPAFQFLYLRSAVAPEVFPWEAGFEPSPHVNVLSDIQDRAYNIVVPGPTYWADAGEYSETYDRIHRTAGGYYDIGFMCQRASWRYHFNHDYGGPVRLRLDKAYWESDTRIAIPIEGPRDSFFTVIDDSSILALEGPDSEAMVDTFRGVYCATKNSSGAWVRLPVTGVGVGGWPGAPFAYIDVNTASVPARNAVFVAAGVRKESGWADSNGTHDGPLGGGITPWYARGAHVPSDPAHNVDLTARIQYDHAMPFYGVIPAPAGG